jgi:hypothetical protein
VTEYFRLHGPPSDRLSAFDTVEDPYEVSLCPVTSGIHQHRSIRRRGDLALEVKHRKRDQLMIWSFSQPVVHASLLAEFAARGFTGYRLRPAAVRFRDGYLSQDYQELCVTGWAGLARPESGIRLLEDCPGCSYRKYSGLEDASRLIDWSQWTGADFFIVWPMPGYLLITRRVADLLASLAVKSYGLDTLSNRGESSVQARIRRLGFTVGRLSQVFPEDLAEKYGSPLGLE